jgi:threonine/homoserine/homoserine lactone efflux protein
VRIKAKDEQFIDPERGPVLSARFAVAIVLVVLGIAWIAYYYAGVRPDPTAFTKSGKPVGPTGIGFLGDLKKWNYVIGFALFFLGLIAAASPKTPLGRNRGVVVGMLGCFVLGLLWICVYYIFSDDLSKIWVFNDLGQYNLVVGIVFMAVGFTYATRWE